MLLTCVSPEYIESRICYPTPLTCKPSRPKELGLTRVNEFDVMSEIVKTLDAQTSLVYEQRAVQCLSA